MKEFDIIERFLKQERDSRKDVLHGIGDDCAITRVPEGLDLAITTDTLISGVHFPVDTPPEAIAHKALAVNLSDLAAMGAEPAWFSLSLSLPNVDESWLEAFSKSLFDVAEYYSIQLIGGDTVQGPLAITITAQGFVPHENALMRSTAKPGDLVYVTGTLGDAGAGLDIKLGKLTATDQATDYLLSRLNYPAPRLLTGTALRRTASSCIDISDGLVQDLQHILNASECGAKIQVRNIPLSESLKDAVDLDDAIQYALSSGDDYELLFTVNEEQRGILETALANANIVATCIGQLTGVKRKLELVNEDEPYQFKGACFEHFNA